MITASRMALRPIRMIIPGQNQSFQNKIPSPISQIAPWISRHGPTNLRFFPCLLIIALPCSRYFSPVILILYEKLDQQVHLIWRSMAGSPCGVILNLKFLSWFSQQGLLATSQMEESPCQQEVPDHVPWQTKEQQKCANDRDEKSAHHCIGDDAYISGGLAVDITPQHKN